MDQGMKHWIQALLGENPFIPYDYYYDVVTWSYPLQRGLAGSGFLTKTLSPGIQMTEIDETELRHRAGRELAGLRLQHGLGARARPRDRPARQGRQRLPRRAAVHRGWQAVLHRSRAGQRSLAGAAAAGTSRHCAAHARHADHRAAGLPGARRQLACRRSGSTRARRRFRRTRCSPGRTSTAPRLLRLGDGAFCEALHDLGVKLGLPVRGSFRSLGRPDRGPAQHRELHRVHQPRLQHRHHDGHSARAHAGGDGPAEVHHRRRQLHRHQHQRDQRRSRRAARRRSTHAPRSPDLLTPGSTFDADVRHEQPGRLGLRPRRLDLP